MKTKQSKMKKLIFAFLCLIVNSAFAQSTSKITTFHRMLIVNENDEIMIIKIKDVDFWVTPGLYQNDHLTIKQGLDSIASTYGLQLSEPKLRAIFTLKSERNGKPSLSTRNVFIMRTKNPETKKPDLIEEIKWLKLNDALAQLTFPHIAMMTESIFAKPDQILGGTISNWKDGDAFKAKWIEPAFEY